MALQVLSAKEYSAKLKATIQASGRLGFTEITATHLKLQGGKFVKFAKDDETAEIFLCVCTDKGDDAFEVKLTSGYYYVAAKTLFDALGLDYIHLNVMFDLVRFPDYDSVLGGEVYKLNKRETKRKSKDMET